MEQRLSLITLGVADMARARAFYEGVLGWRPAMAVDEVAFYQLPGFALALHPRAMLAADALVDDDSGGGFAGFTLAINQRSTAEVDALAAALAAAGARILKTPRATAWGGYHFYFADADGFAWEVAYNSGSAIHPDGATTFTFG
ncbi:MAG: VOC family protein [Hyphomonadaceae bacterium]